jgi:L-iditol 2-dehydrogenase
VRVARTVALGETVIEEAPDPACGPGDVVCRVLACATCGSDVQDAYVARKLPAVLGHEPAGEVMAVGRDVAGVRPGDRVAIHHHAPCGACARCRGGHETLCAAYRASALDPGGFAEYVRVPAELVGELLPLDGLDPVAATCTEPLACALRAVDRAAVRPGESLLVVGAGCSGLLNIAAARARGIDDVRVREPDPDRLARALAWGAREHGAPHRREHGAPHRREHGAPHRRDRAHDDGGAVDAAIVCTSKPAAVAEAAAALAPGGRLVLYAPLAPGEPVGVDGWDVFTRELTVTASWSAGPADMRAALALLREGAVPTDELITARYPLERTGEALAAQRDGRVLKAVVVP